MGILASTFEKRELSVDSSTITDPKQWLIDFFGGGNKAVSGVSVSPESAERLGTVFSCVNVISQDVASIPILTYKRQGRVKERARDHPAFKLLHDEANPYMTAMVFKETIMGHILLRGNGYANIEFNKKGYPVALWPLNPKLTEAVIDKGRLWYVTQLPSGEYRKLSHHEVLHIPAYSFDGIKGKSPIQVAIETIGLAIASESFGSRFFSNGARPSGVLEHPGVLGDNAQTNIRNSWNNIHKGLNNSHRIAILEEGMTYKQIGIAPEDAQFLETRKYQRSEICGLYRISPHKIADLERATFSNIEHSNIDHVVSTLRPWLIKWEQELNRKLFTDKESQVFFCEHLIDAMLRGDSKTRAEVYQKGRQNGYYSTNDILEMENRNPIDDPAADAYLVNGAMISIQTAMTNTTKNQDKGGGSGDGK